MIRSEIGGIWFRFDDLIHEVGAIESVASNFVEYDAPILLRQLRDKIRSSRRGALGDRREWSIEEKRPLRTKVSEGRYEATGKGSHNVYAELTFRWEVTLCDDKGTKKKNHRFFALTGLASTKVRILERDARDGRQELAMWRMEVGDDAHPGCRFHVQVLGEAQEPPFPHSLPVPRFPGILLTPADSLEFVLGEIFQDEWSKHAMRDSPLMNQWKRIQSGRLSRLLQWKRDAVAQGHGSPWTRLKKAHPPRHLFTQE